MCSAIALLVLHKRPQSTGLLVLPKKCMHEKYMKMDNTTTNSRVKVSGAAFQTYVKFQGCSRGQDL